MTKREQRKCDECRKKRVGQLVGNAIYFRSLPPGRYWICDPCKTKADKHKQK